MPCGQSQNFKNVFEGYVEEYDQNGSIFIKTKLSSDKNIVFINGLGGNALFFDCKAALYNFCIKENYNLIIPQLRSYPNFQIISIQDDIDDIKNLVDQIDGKIILIGHSTGCNDILLYLKEHKAGNIKGVILQAPVSDTESADRDQVKIALDMIEKSDPKLKYIELPKNGLYLKERYRSLYEVNGREDLFSSYLPDSKFADWKNKMKILSVLSGKDEFSVTDMSEKFKLMGKVLLIKEGNHSLSSDKCQLEFISCLDTFVKSCFDQN
jgi:pimeloyl-ACP methyl ester carboxylesterase